MADIDTFRTAAKDMPARSPYPTLFRKQFSLVNGAGPQNDVIRLGPIRRGTIVKGAVLAVSATLGSGVTLQLRRDTTALTAATTAAQANFLNQNAVDEPSTDWDDELNVVIAGGNVGATATVTVECWFDNPNE